jgi:hypothetical protein
LPSSLQGVTTIGELLANANGFSFAGTLTGALQAPFANQSTGAPNSASILASVLNPSLNLSPSTSLNIGQFIDTSTGAFPTSAPAQPSTTPDNSFGFSTSDNINSSDTSEINNFTNDQSTAPATTQGGTPAGVYTAFTDVGASTIRGGNLNVVA